MPIRYRKTVKIAGGLKLNVNSKSVSLTAGRPGASVTLNSKGRRTVAVGLPRTGLSYRSTRSVTKPSATNSNVPQRLASSSQQEPPASPRQPISSLPPELRDFAKVVAKARRHEKRLVPWFENPDFGIAARLVYCIIAYQKRQSEIVLRECGPVVTADQPNSASQAILDWAGIGIEFMVGTAVVFVPASRDAAVLMVTLILDTRGELVAARSVAEELSPSGLSTAVRATLALQSDDLDRVLALTATAQTPPQSELHVVSAEIRAQALRRLGKTQEALDLLFTTADAAREGNDSLRCHYYLEIARTLVARDTPSMAWSWLDMARSIDPGSAELDAVRAEIVNWRPATA